MMGISENKKALKKFYISSFSSYIKGHWPPIVPGRDRPLDGQANG